MTEDVFLEEDGFFFLKKWLASEDRWFGLK